VLNVALGNRDNHLRNTALQRFEDGTIRLTPLFDFAPMMLHPDGIARRSRWEGERGASPDWPRVVQQCQEATSLPLVNLPSALRELRARFERLPDLAVEAGVPEGILGRQSLSLDAVRASLAEL
jgi:serine/threonine-protein kinase HipA